MPFRLTRYCIFVTYAI